ncbi:hypothetical protein AADY36_19070 [Pseudoalteromonas sp. D15MCD-2]|uniref:hypothetical protein n=1 Tax=Pseudoalteromonas sp. D15MCD-2 TaxID=3138933 RepID=UPI0031582B3A
MEFDDLKSIIDVSRDLELTLKSPNWEVIKYPISDSGSWMSKELFLKVFSETSEYKNSDEVFAFESFERMYKATGKTNRLNAEFNLNWADFNNFQESTEILYFYLVPQNLSWVLYGNRDFWQFAKGY